MNKEQIIEKMANFIYVNSQNLDVENNLRDCISLARHLYNAGYRKQSDIEELEKKLNDYEMVVGKLSFTVDGVATLLIGENVEYIDKRVAEGLKNLAIKQAKQEITSQVIDEFKNLAINYMTNKELLLTVFKNAITHAEAELKKKYIGE